MIASSMKKSTKAYVMERSVNANHSGEIFKAKLRNPIPDARDPVNIARTTVSRAGASARNFPQQAIS
jgi:hypothetical protein